MIEFFTQNNELVLKLTVAVLAGLIIGAERYFVHKDAGMKTHALVSLGSAVFVIASELLVQKYATLSGMNPVMIPANIIIGAGFLGAGSIIFHGREVRGLTTAGGLWVTAGIGMVAGFGFYSLAIIVTVLALIILSLVNFLERPLRKISDNIDSSH